MDNKDEYGRYLTELHASRNTSQEVILDVVKEATGLTPKEEPIRITAGEVNEVYDVVLPARNNVVVRISKGEHPAFLAEQWAIGECQKVGVPVPAILLIKHIPGGEKVVSFCVQEKLPGDTLERGKVDFHKLDSELLRTLMHQSAEMLYRMNSIPVRQFGELNELGVGKFSTFEAMLRERPDEEDEYLSLARELGIPERDMRRALNLIAQAGHIYRDVQPVFCHGDFAPKHIMFQENRLTGILDFGEVTGHHPIFDFARWEYWYDTGLAYQYLKEGYPDQSIFSPENQKLARLLQLDMCLVTIYWYSQERYPKGIKHGVDKLKQTLDYFK